MSELYLNERNSIQKMETEEPQKAKIESEETSCSSSDASALLVMIQQLKCMSRD